MAISGKHFYDKTKITVVDEKVANEELIKLRQQLLLNRNKDKKLTANEILQLVSSSTIYDSCSFISLYHSDSAKKETSDNDHDKEESSVENDVTKNLDNTQNDAAPNRNQADLLLHFKTEEKSGYVLYQSTGYEKKIEKGKAKQVETYTFCPNIILSTEVKQEKKPSEKMSFFEIIQKVCENIFNFFSTRVTRDSKKDITSNTNEISQPRNYKNLGKEGNGGNSSVNSLQKSHKATSEARKPLPKNVEAFNSNPIGIPSKVGMYAAQDADDYAKELNKPITFNIGFR